MDVIFSKHALEQMYKRGISYEMALSVVSHPGQTITDSEDSAIVICQSIVTEAGVPFLLRVFVNKIKHPNVVVTLYKTTKISKYYESKV